MRRPFAALVLTLSVYVPSGFAQAGFAQLGFGQSKSPSLSRLVIVGDSLSAGFQNFSLLETQQIHGYASLIAAQAGTPMVLPLVKFPGIPNVLQLKSLSPPVVEPIEAPPLMDPGIARTDPYAVPTNLAVPGVTIDQVLNKRPGPLTPTSSAIDFMTDVVLGYPAGPPQSQVERAVSMSPTTVIFWAGSNDLLMAELTGDLRMLTPPASFLSSLDKAVSKLSNTGASVVIANLPDPTIAPYFISAEDIAQQANVPVAYVRLALGLLPGDKIRPAAQRLIPGILANPTTGPLPKTCTAPVPGDPVIPGLPFTQVPCVFRLADALLVKSYAALFNGMILTEATLRHAPLVDIFSLENNLQKNGYTVNGQHLTLDFLGGLISLDGLHPTNTLHAIIANEFIKTMNHAWKTNIPAVSVEDVAKTDPLLPPKI